MRLKAGAIAGLLLALAGPAGSSVLYWTQVHYQDVSATVPPVVPICMYVDQGGPPRVPRKLCDADFQAWVSAGADIIDYHINGDQEMAQPGGATGTTSVVGVMMGMASGIGDQTALVTPAVTGNFYVKYTGYLINNTATQGGVITLRYGSGTIPSNGDALTGTIIGTAKTWIGSNANRRAPVQLLGYVTGLTIGTQYWFDVSLASTNVSNTVTPGGMNFVMLEK